MTTQRWSIGITVLYLEPLRYMEWSPPRPGRFTSGNGPVLIVYEAEWAPGPVWTSTENLAPHRDSIPGPFNP